MLRRSLLPFIGLMLLCSVAISQPQSAVYVGSKQAGKFHVKTCRYAKRIKLKNLRYFSSEKEARDAGYKPCKVCIQ